MEKGIKAHVCARLRTVPPKIHNLRRLYDMAELPEIESFYAVLANINQFNIEGRYPDLMPVVPELETARSLMEEAEKVLQWLTKQL